MADSKPINFTLRWVKAHAATTEIMQKYNVQPWEVIGNCTADALADRGATLAEVWSHDSAGVLYYYSLVRQIQARAVVILSTIMQNRLSSVTGRKAIANTLKAIPPSGQLLNIAHSFTSYEGVLQCCMCLQRAPVDLRSRKLWLCTPCRPDRELFRTLYCASIRPTPIPVGKEVVVGRTKLHSDHRIVVYRGLYYCLHCGCTASSKPQRLSSPCTERGENAVKRVLALKRGKLPSGYPAWPNDSSEINYSTIVFDES